MDASDLNLRVQIQHVWIRRHRLCSLNQKKSSIHLSVKRRGGNFIVRKSFSELEMNPLVHIEGPVTGNIIQDILKNLFISWDKRTHGRVFTLQQDNSPRDTSKVLKDFIAGNKLRALAWPSESLPQSYKAHVAGSEKLPRRKIGQKQAGNAGTPSA